MIPLDPTPEQLEVLTEAVAALIARHHASIAEQPSADVAGAEELADTFREPLPEQGRPAPEVLARLAAAFAKSFNTAGPGYLAFIPGGGLPVSALGEWLGHAFNRYVGVNAAAPALAQLERSAVDWLASLMGYPASSRGILTTGGSLSNFSALCVARSEKLPEDFLRGVLYVSEETHLSVLKAARLAGFPARSVRALPVDARFRLEPAAVERAIAEDRARGLQPFLIVANAGSTNTGAVDPLPELAALARREGLWLHADAAYGGFFQLVPEGAAALRGLALADSITLDPHKGLFLPYGTGCLLVRDGEALLRAHRGDAAYLRDVHAGSGEPNFTDLSPELSREFRGVRLWLPLMLHGVSAFREALAEKLALSRKAFEQLSGSPRFEVLCEPQLSVIAFRLRGAADAAQLELLRRVNARGRVFLSSTTLRGQVALRICVLSFRTHEERVRDAVEALLEEAALLQGDTQPYSS